MGFDPTGGLLTRVCDTELIGCDPIRGEVLWNIKTLAGFAYAPSPLDLNVICGYAPQVMIVARVLACFNTVGALGSPGLRHWGYRL